MRENAFAIYSFQVELHGCALFVLHVVVMFNISVKHEVSSGVYYPVTLSTKNWEI